MKRGQFAPQSISCFISPPTPKPLGPTINTPHQQHSYMPTYLSPTSFFSLQPSYRHTSPCSAYNLCYSTNMAPITFPVNNELSLIICTHLLIILSQNTPPNAIKAPQNAVVTPQKHHIFIIFTSFLLISVQLLTIFYKFPAIFTKSLHFTTFCSIIRYKERDGSSARVVPYIIACKRHSFEYAKEIDAPL